MNTNQRHGGDWFYEEAEEFILTTEQELRDTRCQGCGHRLTSFKLLLCCECLGVQNPEFDNLIHSVYTID